MVLDFVHAFHLHEVRDALVYALATVWQRGGAALYGYVVTPHHVHMDWRQIVRGSDCRVPQHRL